MISLGFFWQIYSVGLSFLVMDIGRDYVVTERAWIVIVLLNVAWDYGCHIVLALC